MNTLSYKTKSANAASVERKWLVIDVEGEIVGRIASKIAAVLRGKHKPDFTPHFDNGDHVIVLNSALVRFTGEKMTDKVYLRHTGYPGGQRKTTPRDIMARKPERVLEMAIRGMLPKTKLGRAQIKKLHIYAGTDHPHAAQTPTELK
ncbi:50S ribosomal protein L13 [Neolewinella antarctica]|uniref:Large ribosomal subunit protein uL13 n=1 Tax=Neolewinella antarctica TaxID=442734 RepID=A0ABX0XCW6_9BACT|nr:50S ribosomal protein L13 [Neolewinella antarctica]NJC26627.1 large subunit ribosomal protein L13 [Neolewinella antarctica]